MTPSRRASGSWPRSAGPSATTTWPIARPCPSSAGRTDKGEAMTFKKMPGVKSIETKHMEERAELVRALKSLDRRSFLKVSAAAMGAVAAQGLVTPHSFQPVSIANAATGKVGIEPFTFAYISDSHLYDKTV